tara:strand:- start:8400 stop:8672 length:273 start_codon:yes stop_codon:yes gene_type:complete
MAKRFFKEHASGDSEWTPEARKMLEEASEVVRIFLDEEEEGGPITLREFDFIFKAAVTNVVTDESIRRRCLPDGEKSLSPKNKQLKFSWD